MIHFENPHFSKEEILSWAISEEDKDISFLAEGLLYIAIPGRWEFTDLLYPNGDQTLETISHDNFSYLSYPINTEDAIQRIFYKTYSDLMIRINDPKEGDNNLYDLYQEFMIHPDQGDAKICDDL